MLPSSFYTAKEIQEQMGLVPELSSSFNFRLDIQNDRVLGFVDEAQALAQAVYMMIMTERGKYSIYPDDYGLQKEDLYGKQRKYIEAALSYRIPQCLLSDLRIKSVDNLDFYWANDKCLVVCDITSVFGDIEVTAPLEVQGT